MQRLNGVGEFTALGGSPAARQNFTCVGIHHVAIGIHRRQRRNKQPARKLNREAADAALHRPFHTISLADRCASARANTTFLDGLVSRSRRGSLAGFARRADTGLANAQIKQNRRWHNRHLRVRRRKSHAFLFQVPPDAARRFQPKRTAAGQRNGMNGRCDMLRIHHIEFRCAGGTAANIAASHRAVLAEDYGAAGECVQISSMSDADAGDIGEAFHSWLLTIVAYRRYVG